MKNSFLNGTDGVCNFSWERGWLEGLDHFWWYLTPPPLPPRRSTPSSEISSDTWQNRAVEWVLLLWGADAVPMLLNHATLWNTLVLTVFYNESNKNQNYCKSLWFLESVLNSVLWNLSFLTRTFNHLLLLAFAFSSFLFWEIVHWICWTGSFFYPHSTFNDFFFSWT